MGLFLPRRWNKQPSYNVGVDWNNPLTQNIRNLWNMSQRGMVDAVGNANGTPIGGVGLASSAEGISATFDSSGTTYVDLPRPAQFNLASGSRWTLLFRVATTTDTAQTLWNYGDGTANNRCAIFIGNNVTNAFTDELITWARIIGNVQTPIMCFATTTRTLLVDGFWHTVMITSNGSTCSIWLDGISRAITLGPSQTNNGRIDITGTATTATLGAQNVGTISGKFNGAMSLGAFWSRDMSQFALELHRQPWQLFRPASNQTFYSLPGKIQDIWYHSEEWQEDVVIANQGKFPNLEPVSAQDIDFNQQMISNISDDEFSTLKSWNEISTALNKSVTAGKVFDKDIVQTYSLAYTSSAFKYAGGVIAPNGDIHFVPYSAPRGQKLSSTGQVSTYSLVYTINNASVGGVLFPMPIRTIAFSNITVPYAFNAWTLSTIYFAPFNAGASRGDRGQRLTASGVVSSYPLAGIGTSFYSSSSLNVKGEMHFIPCNAPFGSKLTSLGILSTYSLLYTTNTAYSGGVLAPNGDIHFVPENAAVGQKVSANGEVSTYSLVYTVTSAYKGGVLASNGDIHFIPNSAVVGQKISINGTVSTYSLAYTTSNAYYGGVLAPNGDIHFVPGQATVGQKISASGVVSTYSLAHIATFAYVGGVLDSDGNIHFIPFGANVGQKVYTNSALPFSFGVRISPYLNKF